jgi:hypothetical protein
MNKQANKTAVAVTLAMVCIGSTRAAEVFTALGAVYKQDFNDLPFSGTNLTWENNSTINGWYRNYGGNIAEPGRDTSIQAEDVNASGVSSQTGFMNAGLSGKSDRSVVVRALYTKQAAVGAVFQNKSGKASAGFSVGYTGEQWRRATAAPSALCFEYAVVSSVNEGTLDIQSDKLQWIRVDALEFVSPSVEGSGSGLNGTKKIFQKIFEPVTVKADVPDGSYLIVRWLVDDPVNHHAFGIDDVQIFLLDDQPVLMLGAARDFRRPLARLV